MWKLNKPIHDDRGYGGTDTVKILGLAPIYLTVNHVIWSCKLYFDIITYMSLMTDCNMSWFIKLKNFDALRVPLCLWFIAAILALHAWSG